MDVKKEFLGILQDYVDFPVEEVVTDVPFKAASGVDSFMLMELVGALEDHFGVSIPNRDLMGLKTADDMIGYIEKRIAA
ncbi:MAG: acyl carrier protein [Bacteroidales bacterium]|nr:acyl carrier protein [Bacteroidales bacterium]MBR2478477.1 acyl carrier protein [Bacteroidales bacterium]